MAVTCGSDVAGSADFALIQRRRNGIRLATPYADLRQPAIGHAKVGANRPTVPMMHAADLWDRYNRPYSDGSLRP